VLQFIRVFTSFSTPQADIGHLDLLESSLNLAFTSTSSINSVNAYHNPKSNMESTGRKRRVADVESDVGSKRSKQADGQQQDAEQYCHPREFCSHEFWFFDLIIAIYNFLSASDTSFPNPYLTHPRK
jgi:hypothetical protein